VATPELVAELNPYGVIVATGAKPIIPPIPGATLPHVYTVEQAITGQVDLSGKKVAVIGGGVTGLETAHVLAEKSDVTVLEMSKFLAATVYGTVRLLLMDELKAAGVKVLNLQRVNEITETGVKITDLKSGEDAVVDADAVVLSVGIRPEETVAEQFEAAFDHVALVGDAENAANIAEALRAAHGKAWVF
jgi:pyruvate/2-oxoglutarate dehydrogenase complex dihydrolipoamide dehydrogenase (E3) component